MREIIERWRRTIDGYFEHYELVESSVDNASGFVLFMRAHGVFVCKKYKTQNSPIHNLTASPGEFLWQESTDLWHREGESNGFKLKTTSEMIHNSDTGISTLTTEYEIPEGYTGPHYKKRVVTIYLAEKKILTVKMIYQDGQVDCGIFSHNGDEEVEIAWSCEYGPNKHNENEID